MYVEKWILIAVALLFLFIFVLAIRLGKQVRALRFCFMHFSDAVKGEIDENAHQIEQVGGVAVAAVLKGLTRVW